jgi:hypothetical protein
MNSSIINLNAEVRTIRKWNFGDQNHDKTGWLARWIILPFLISVKSDMLVVDTRRAQRDSAEKTSELRHNESMAENENRSPVISQISVPVIDCY